MSTDGSGNASFNLLLPTGSTPGHWAPETTPDGSTSEFSAATEISPPVVLGVAEGVGAADQLEIVLPVMVKLGDGIGTEDAIPPPLPAS